MIIEKLFVIKTYILNNLYKGFIKHSQAPFATPVFFIKKPDGSLRFCIDFCKLNDLICKNRYPLFLIDETLVRLDTTKIFTKLNIYQTFHCIRIDKQLEELTIFKTRYNTYKYKVLPFGLTNGPAIYQRYINDVLFEYLDNFYSAYLNNILIYSFNILEYKKYIYKILMRLRNVGLQIDIKKCKFNVTKTKYLGFIIRVNGIEVDSAKINVV